MNGRSPESVRMFLFKFLSHDILASHTSHVHGFSPMLASIYTKHICIKKHAIVDEPCASLVSFSQNTESHLHCFSPMSKHNFLYEEACRDELWVSLSKQLNISKCAEINLCIFKYFLLKTYIFIIPEPFSLFYLHKLIS